MEELLEFLNKRVEHLRRFGEDKDDEPDGDTIFNLGVEDGRFKEAVFIRDKINKMILK